MLDISKDPTPKIDCESITMKNLKKVLTTRISSTGKQRARMNDMDLILNQVVKKQYIDIKLL